MLACRSVAVSIVVSQCLTSQTRRLWGRIQGPLFPGHHPWLRRTAVLARRALAKALALQPERCAAGGDVCGMLGAKARCRRRRLQWTLWCACLAVCFMRLECLTADIAPRIKTAKGREPPVSYHPNLRVCVCEPAVDGSSRPTAARSAGASSPSRAFTLQRLHSRSRARAAAATCGSRLFGGPWGALLW